MGKKWRVEITDREAGRTAAWVMRNCLGLTRREVNRLKYREGGICLDGCQIRSSRRMEAGDVLELEKSPGEEDDLRQHPSHPGHLEPLVLYEDEDLLVMNKPPGMAVHPVGCHEDGTLQDLAAEYLGAADEEERPKCAGRLDKETSGCVVFAKSRLAAARLQRQREQGIFGKEYLAVVTGHLEPKMGCVELPIGKIAENTQKERMEISENGKRAVTHYQVLKSLGQNDLIRLELETGRTHQIRVHMAALGHPLAGDLLYGSDGTGDSDRAALHAWHVWFDQPFSGRKIRIEAPFPADFVERLGGAYDINDVVLSGKGESVPDASPGEEKGGCE